MQVQSSPNLQLWRLPAVNDTGAPTGTPFIRSKPTLCSREKAPEILFDIGAFQGSSKPWQIYRVSIFQFVIKMDFTITIEPQYP